MEQDIYCGTQAYMDLRATERRAYAIAALQALIVRGDVTDPKALAYGAFEQADAMLIEENKR